MAKIPSGIAETEHSIYLASQGWQLVSRGKVRDIYRHPQQEDLLVQVATDRISIFDFVLPALVPRKGEVLTALTWYWLTEVLYELPNHLFQDRSSHRLNATLALLGQYPELDPRRCLVVNAFPVQPFEIIWRGHIGGSAWNEYSQDGTVAGEAFKPGLEKWSWLSPPRFTPSTKEAVGHDVNITVEEYRKRVAPRVATATINLTKRAYEIAYALALRVGVVILDTKLEVSADGKTIVDEVITPDSSRFTSFADLGRAVAERRDPTFFDKELVRQWGRGVKTPFGVTGINQLSPNNPDHVAFVHNLTVPPEVIKATTKRYLNLFSLLTSGPLQYFQLHAMGIKGV